MVRRCQIAITGIGALGRCVPLQFCPVSYRSVKFKKLPVFTVEFSKKRQHSNSTNLFHTSSSIFRMLVLPHHQFYLLIKTTGRARFHRGPERARRHFSTIWSCGKLQCVILTRRLLRSNSEWSTTGPSWLKCDNLKHSYWSFKSNCFDCISTSVPSVISRCVRKQSIIYHQRSPNRVNPRAQRSAADAAWKLQVPVAALWTRRAEGRRWWQNAASCSVLGRLHGKPPELKARSVDENQSGLDPEQSCPG